MICKEDTRGREGREVSILLCNLNQQLQQCGIWAVGICLDEIKIPFVHGTQFFILQWKDAEKGINSTLSWLVAGLRVNYKAGSRDEETMSILGNNSVAVNKTPWPSWLFFPCLHTEGITFVNRWFQQIVRLWIVLNINIILKGSPWGFLSIPISCCRLIHSSLGYLCFCPSPCIIIIFVAAIDCQCIINEFQ